jgi:hypothetical protein
MAYSMKSGGKEIGPASVYAEPHTMDGKKMKIPAVPGKEPSSSKLGTMDVSIGNISKSAGNEPIKDSGIKVRGTGCATKGLMARGPMA